MKQFVLIAMVVLTIAFLSTGNLFAEVVTDTITVISPNGGWEVWKAGETHTIGGRGNYYSPTREPLAVRVNMEYSKDNFVNDKHQIGLAEGVTSSISNTGICYFLFRYDWVIPDDPSTTVKIRVTFLGAGAYKNSDNYFTIKKWNNADINNDGVVNAKDAVCCGNAFGTTPDDSNWDIRCDLNKDGFINAKDVVLLGTEFGKVKE